MEAGRRNRLFSLEAPAQVVAGAHGTPDWPVQDIVWASMDAVGGSAEGLIDQAIYRIGMNFRTDVKSTWRLGLMGTKRKFRILNPPQDPDGHRRDLMITVQETL